MDPTILYRANESFAAYLTEAAYADLSAPDASGTTGVELFNHVRDAQRGVAALLGQFESSDPLEALVSGGMPDPVDAMGREGEGFGDAVARNFRRAARAIEDEFTRARGRGEEAAIHVDEAYASHTALVVDATRQLALILGID